MSILRQAFNASEERANYLLEQLPLELAGTIRDRVAESTLDATTEQKMNLAIKHIVLGFDEAQTSENKGKMYGIFNQVCRVRNEGDTNLLENHIQEDDQIDQLLQSLEMAETISVLDAWAGEIPERRIAADRILKSINNAGETSLDLDGLSLDTLPDVFMNSKLLNIKELYLSNNRLQSLPESIGDLVSLNELYLGNNQLQSLPERICDLVGLDTLDLFHNQLRILPERFGDLKNLNELNLYFNQLQSLPESICNLTSLMALNVSRNQLQSLPERIGDLVSLGVLELFHNQLQRIPDSIGVLRRLRTLTLSQNRLQSIPDTIHDMGELRTLDLRINALVDLPNTILGLHSVCTVKLENAGLSMAVIERLRSACSAEGYSGPRIHFSIQEDRSNLARYGSIQEAFSSICNKAGIADTLSFEERYPQLQESMTAGNNKERSLFSWLSRLSYMKDTQREGETGLFKVILSHLDLAESKEEFRSTFFSIIDDAAATCGDRMALSVLHLGIAHKRQSIDKSDLKGLAHFIIHGQWMLEQLERIAREKVTTLSFVDEIEVFLAYPVMLKVRLNLPIDVNEMLYFRCSQVTEQDLENAVTSIEGMLEGPDADANILVQREDWVKALKGHRSTSSGIAALQRYRTTRLERGEDATEIQSEYESALVALTKRILDVINKTKFDNFAK